MPCYNVAATLDETLSSLVRQSITDFEVVLVDDGSTDGTLACLQKWVDHDRRFRVISLAHQGIIPALNAGLKACQSVYIARLDADDRALPYRLQRQVEMLDAYPGLSVVSSLVRGFPQENLGTEFRNYIDWLNSLQTNEDIKRGIFKQSPLAHPSVAYRRDAVERVGGYQDHGWAEDYDLWMRLYLAGADFGKVPQVLLEWRDHPRRLTHTDSRYSNHNDLRLKANYLVQGPLSGFKEVWIWGPGSIANQLAEQLFQLGHPVSGYITLEKTPAPIESSLVPTITSEMFLEMVHSKSPPIVLIADPLTKDRSIISQQLTSMRLLQGIDWWEV